MIIKRLQNSPMITYIDQALVSGLNFVTAIALTRTLGIEMFGVYTILFVGILLITTAHYSVFAAPMMSYGPKVHDDAERQSYYSSTHLAQIIACIIIAITTYLVGYAVVAVTNNNSIINYLFPLAFSVLVIPPQEWLRRYIFTEHNSSYALFLDIIKTVIQLGLILTLSLLNMLNVELTLLSIAIASLVTYLTGLTQTKLSLRRTGVIHSFLENWRLGRHLLPTYLMDWVRLQGFLIVGGIFIGVNAVGAVRAAQNIVGPLNIIYQAADNILPIEGAKQLSKLGHNGMVDYFKTTGFRSFLALLGLCIIIALSSKWLMGFIYGKPYENYYTLVIWQLLSLLVLFSYRVGASFMRTVNSTKPLALSSALSIVVLSSLIVPCSTAWGEDGLMLSKVIAEISAVIFLWYNLLRHLRLTH